MKQQTWMDHTSIQFCVCVYVSVWH